MPTQSANANVVNASVVGTAETAAVTSTALTSNVPHPAGLLVQGFVNVTPGTGITTVQLTVRQGSGAGGTVVTTGQPIAVIAGSPIDLPFYVLDGSPAQGAQYTVTVTQAGGAGTGTINAALITVDEIENSG